MRIKQLFQQQRGDTIIEVMLAVSVIGLVLGSSYAIANRSIGIGREAQERTEALKQVETQVERLRTASTVSGNELVDFPATSAFCLTEDISIVDFTKPDFESFTEIEKDEVTYPDGDDSSRPCNLGTDDRYGIVITRSEADDTYLFTVRARWEAIGGGPLQELTSQYRIYPVGNTAFEAIVPPPVPPPDDGVTDPEVGPVAVSNVTNTNAKFSSSVVSDGGDDSIIRGFVYINANRSSIELTTSGVENITVPSGSTDFSITPNGLTRDTTYSVRAYIINDASIAYSSNTERFTTDNNYNIGDTGPGGGLVFYIKSSSSNGWRYLEVLDPVMNSGPIRCARSFQTMFGRVSDGDRDYQDFGSGLEATKEIVNRGLCTPGNFAQKAIAASNGGQNDWYVPNFTELIEVAATTDETGFSPSQCELWSSSVYNLSSRIDWDYVVDVCSDPSVPELGYLSEVRSFVLVRRF